MLVHNWAQEACQAQFGISSAGTVMSLQKKTKKSFILVVCYNKMFLVKLRGLNLFTVTVLSV